MDSLSNLVITETLLKEWQEETYPPFANGPGYIVSNDIARTVSKKHRKGRLKVRPQLCRSSLRVVHYNQVLGIKNSRNFYCRYSN